MLSANPAELDDLDFSCKCFQAARAARRPGRIVRADAKTFLVQLPGGKVIGRTHTEDLAKARAAEVGGTWKQVAA